MNKPILYIMCGLPYAGKTTLTKELVKRFSFPVVSMDKVMDKNNLDDDAMTQEDWNFVYSEGYKQLIELLTLGKSVILDLGNLKKSERNTAREIAAKTKADHKLIYINIPKEEITVRWKRNEKTKSRGQLSKNGLKRAFNQFQEPSNEEGVVLYNQQMDLESWISGNIANNEHS